VETEKKPKKPKYRPKINVENRKASYEYQLMDEFEAGMVLLGSEIKSIRKGNANISDAYCYLNNGQIIIKNMHISALQDAAVPHEPLRDRVLLLTKKEIKKIESKVKVSGISLIPTLLYEKKGMAKIKIRLAKGKKLYDKRESIKAKDIKRDTDREINY